jgi:cytochrome d ubiquinol oxidase subunit II
MGDLPLLLAAVLTLSLAAYVLFGGADFGGGVWDLLASGPRRDRQRDLIAHAIGPIWEANHVWLILAIVLTFTCFPPVYARLGTVLHIPLSLMLVGIVLRGSAFIFRSHHTDRTSQDRWGRVFAIASLLTPILLGMCIGAVVSGRVVEDPTSSFTDQFVLPWLTPFTAAIGGLTLAMFALLAAVFLTMETHDPELADDFRRRALWAGLAVFATAFLSLALSTDQAPVVREGLIGSGWALPFHLLTGAAALAVLGALWMRRYRLARMAVGVQVLCIVGGWGMSQYPLILPPDLTIAEAAAPPVTLRLTMLVLMGGSVVLLPSLIYLFRVFKSAPADQPGPDARGG